MIAYNTRRASAKQTTMRRSRKHILKQPKRRLGISPNPKALKFAFNVALHHRGFQFEYHRTNYSQSFTSRPVSSEESRTISEGPTPSEKLLQQKSNNKSGLQEEKLSVYPDLAASLVQFSIYSTHNLPFT